MLLGYNTNGWAHHDPLDAIAELANLGYQSIAITLDHGRLNPFDVRFPDELRRTRALLDERNLTSVVETGARFLLDPKMKHEPTLVSSAPEARSRRIDFYYRAIDAARALGSSSVSLWSGIARDQATEEQLLERIAESLAPVLDRAAAAGVWIAFEPEPGMVIDTMSRFTRLLQWIDHAHLKLTLDIGHLYCQGELPIADYVARWSDRMVNVHLEDMRADVHEHLMFGEGEMEFPPIIAALARCGYQGGVHVELSRHSHEAPQAARKAWEFLAPLFNRALGK